MLPMLSTRNFQFIIVIDCSPTLAYSSPRKARLSHLEINLWMEEFYFVFNYKNKEEETHCISQVLQGN